MSSLLMLLIKTKPLHAKKKTFIQVFFYQKKLLISLITYSVQVILCKYNLLYSMPISSSTIFMTVWKALLGNGRFLSETDISMSFQDKGLFSRRNLKGEFKSQVYLCRKRRLGTSSPLVLYLRTFPLQKVPAFRLIDS